MLPDATFALAVGVQARPEDYPFPPRPETLSPLEPAPIRADRDAVGPRPTERHLVHHRHTVIAERTSGD